MDALDGQVIVTMMAASTILTVMSHDCRKLATLRLSAECYELAVLASGSPTDVSSRKEEQGVTTQQACNRAPVLDGDFVNKYRRMSPCVKILVSHRECRPF